MVSEVYMYGIVAVVNTAIVKVGLSVGVSVTVSVCVTKSVL